MAKIPYNQVKRKNLDGKFRIEYLADHLEAIPLLQEWFEEEWDSYYGPTGPGDAQSDLLSYANRVGLPVGVVAFHDNKVCGVAALKAESITTHSHLSPWVAAYLVSPSHRRKGIGTKILRAIEEVARKLGYSSVYCGTCTATHLLERNGWQFIEQVTHNGEGVSIFQKAI